MDASTQAIAMEVDAPSAPSSSSAAASATATDDPMRDIAFVPYSNDGSDATLQALVTLKNIFSRQLPKMPKEYIVRLVFDKRHTSLALERKGQIIGGVCYRAYFEQRFGEIAFLAISGTEQVKGFGTILMNALKAHTQRQGLEYYLTYADNYAIGYFQKQGFSKNIAMPKDRWYGFIKDYDGGTLMECYIHPAVDYNHVKQIVQVQRGFVLERAIERSTSHVTYGGLELFQGGSTMPSVLDVPGVMEAGWTALQAYKGATERDRNNAQSKLNQAMQVQVNALLKSEHAWPFANPVDTDTVPGYREIVRDPVDLKMVLERIRTGGYYRNRFMLQADLYRMVDNCKLFNAAGTNYHAAAEQFSALIPRVAQELSAIDP